MSRRPALTSSPQPAGHNRLTSHTRGGRPGASKNARRVLGSGPANPFLTLVPSSESLELSRLVQLGRAPANGQGWFCTQAFRVAAGQAYAA